MQGMKGKRTSREQYLMENIQVALKKAALLNKTQLEQLAGLPSVDALRSDLISFGYPMPSKMNTLADFNLFYNDRLAEVRQFLSSIDIPNSFVDIFFIHTDTAAFLGNTLQTADFDQYMIRQYKKAIEDRTHPLITKMCRTKIDYYNLQCCFRHKTRPADEDFVKGGFLSTKDLNGLNPKGVSALQQIMATPHYSGLIPKKAQNTDYHIAFDALIYSYFQPYKKSVRGIEPIFTYIYDMKFELFDLRCLFKAKLYGLPADTWQKELRGLYV